MPKRERGDNQILRGKQRGEPFLKGKGAKPEQPLAADTEQPASGELGVFSLAPPTEKKEATAPEPFTLVEPEVVVEKETGPDDERKEKIRQATAEAYEEFVNKDLDQKIGRLSKGTNIPAEELAALKQRFLNSREKIVNDSTDVLFDRKVSPEKPFDIEKIRKMDANLVIWGELNRMAYEKYWTPDSKEVFFGPTVNPVDGTEDKTAPRAIADHVIAKPGLQDLAKLNPDVSESLSKKEKMGARDERMKELARKLIDQFTVHGIYEKGVFQLKSDLDGESFLLLLKLAGFDVREDNVEYVKKGQSTSKESSFQGDTSSEPRKHGFVVQGLGKIIIADHHEEGVSDRDSCATSLLFEGLKDFGLFEDRLIAEEMNALEQYVEFVKKHDNQDYIKEESEEIFKNYKANLVGLMRYLPEDDLFKIFVEKCKGGKKFDPYASLEEGFLKNIKFPDIDGQKADYKKVKYKLAESRARSNKAIIEISKERLVVHTGGGQYGDVLIDTGRYNSDGSHTRKVGWGWPAARGKKYGAYVVFDPERHYFQIYTENEIKFDLGQGKNIRGHYILFKGSEDNPLTVTLRDVLAALSGDPNYKIDPKLQKALDADKEKQEKERLEYIAKQERENKIQEIAGMVLAYRKSSKIGVTETNPTESDFDTARFLMKSKEDQENLRKIFTKEQYNVFLRLKEALKRAKEELSENYTKEVPEQMTKDLEKDLANFIKTELVGNRKIFPEDKAKDLPRIVQNGFLLDNYVNIANIKFD